ncbi:MAG: LCP family protein [Clostridiales bacterium]|nr:LCP family protein [Clostridiales bacterium]
MKKSFVFVALFSAFFIIVMAAPYMNYNTQLARIKDDNNTKHLEDTSINPGLIPQLTKVPEKNILVLGIDSRKGEPSRSDVIIVLGMREEKVIFVSVPRDSQITTKSKGNIKINSSYAHGGIDYNKKVVEDLFKIKIDNYLVLNFNAIKNGVDALGGFTVTLPKDIKISDPELKKKFMLKKGTHTLNGIQTLEYLRYRNDGKGDIARLYRQQQFVKDLQDSFLKMENIPLIPRAYVAIHNDIKTDMGASDMARYFIQGNKLKDKFEYHTLKGQGKMVDKVSYYIIDKNSLSEIRKLLSE